MRKVLLVLLALLVILPGAALADEVKVSWKKDGSTVQSDVLTDNDPYTMQAIAAAEEQNMNCELPYGKSVRTVFVRTDSKLETVEWQYMDEDRHWVTVEKAVNPAAEFVLRSEDPVSGTMRVRFTYSNRRATKLQELRLFTDDVLPEGIHAWQPVKDVDVLVIVDDATTFRADDIEDWFKTGGRVAFMSLTSSENGPVDALDALWDAGLRMQPDMGGFKASNASASATLKNWKKDRVIDVIAQWLRDAKPAYIVNASEVAELVLEDAMDNASVSCPIMDMNDDVLAVLRELAAARPASEGEATAEEAPEAEPETEANEPASSLPTGITIGKSEEAEEAPEEIPEEAEPAPVLGAYVADTSYYRPDYLDLLEDATVSETSMIPYPDNRDAEGYLAEGEFIYEDADNGLWAYLSPTVQVEIVQYDLTKPDKQRIFVSNVKFKPEEEQFKQHVWVNASRKGQLIYPETLAQSGKLVFAINGDFYPYRVEKKNTIGNIVRNGEVIYNMDNKKTPQFPNLDSMALHDDGTMTVYAVKEVSADELAKVEGIHDVLSFGPYLIRDGELRHYTGKNYDHREPRTAIGMVSAGHYIIINCEGRVPKGPRGLDLNEVGNLLYGFGCEQGFMLDGGSTSVLMFMGNRLNRIGKDTFVGSPRNQHELFGVGYSDQVHTEWADGKPKK